MRLYNYYTYGEDNGYGIPELDDAPKGQIKMSIYLSSQSIQDNILFKDCTYVGLTFDKAIDDTYVIEYGKQKLKVLYVNPEGRYKQIFLKEM
jgi:hypothetical protein